MHFIYSSKAINGNLESPVIVFPGRSCLLLLDTNLRNYSDAVLSLAFLWPQGKQFHEWESKQIVSKYEVTVAAAAEVGRLKISFVMNVSILSQITIT